MTDPTIYYSRTVSEGYIHRGSEMFKRLTNQDHVCHKRCLAIVFTTVPRYFLLGGGFNSSTSKLRI